MIIHKQKTPNKTSHAITGAGNRMASSFFCSQAGFTFAPAPATPQEHAGQAAGQTANYWAAF